MPFRIIARLLFAAAVAVLAAWPALAQSPEPVTSHPRLWLTAEDLPRYRSWATDANPLWRDGFWPLVERMTADMDSGVVPGEDPGNRGWTIYPTESYAELFAFVSLVHPDAAVREAYAKRARTLLMYAIDEAAKGPELGIPFREPDFTFVASDRLRWWGESWALTVDWIYPVLSADDKATIRKVFLRWSDEMVAQGYNHPEPVGLLNDPALFENRQAFRNAGNNYFGSHLRNVGMMAMALDAADDPDGKLAAYLPQVIGAHLYMNDALLRTDAAGGMAPEGFEYSPQALGYIVQFLLALKTAGLEDPARFGPQVVLTDNPFWGEVIPAFLHSLSNVPKILPGAERLGLVYEPAWYGDGEVYGGPDMIGLLGPLARYDEITGNTARLDTIRWIQTFTPPGGAERLIDDRVFYANGSALMNAILYFMLFDPEAPAPKDPRPAQALFHFAPGIGHLLARTGWDEKAAWFVYNLGWIAIDHQTADGNGFSYYRKGEWLTKPAIGYGGEYGDEDASDDWYYTDSAHANTLALENEAPWVVEPTDYTSQLYWRGSQWEYVPAGDPTILAMSVEPGYAYALGDATNLYNSVQNSSMDMRHASRSIVWLAPDVIVVYDRAESATAGRFKRFWLNLTAGGTVEGTRATITTATGQQLVVDSLLPEGAVPEVRPLDNPLDSRADGDPITNQLMIEAPGKPASARFLTVLQGVDAGAEGAAAVRITSDDGAFAGAAVDRIAVLFPVTLGREIGAIAYTVPTGTQTQLVTGLPPGAAFDVTTTASANGIAVSITAGATYRANDGGVLQVGTLPSPLGTSSLAFTKELIPIVAKEGEEPPAETLTEGQVDDVAEAAGEALESDDDDDEADDDSAEDGAQSEALTPEQVDAAAEAAGEALDSGAVEEPAVDTAVEDAAVLAGEGWIVYEASDAEGRRHLYRIAATPGATAVDLTAAFDARGDGVAYDESISISPDGKWIALGSPRFDPQCDGWPCLSLLAPGATEGEVVLLDGQAIHPEGWAVVANGGDLVAYPQSGGPHALDLWAIRRSGGGWSAPLLLTAASPYAFNHTAALSMDGARLLFDCGNDPYGAPGTAICEVGTDATAFRVVVGPEAGPYGAPDAALHHADYDPEGGVVFQASWDGGLWRVPAGAADRVEPIGAAPSGDYAPCVMADGRIASLWYGWPSADGTAQVRLRTPDGATYGVLVTGAPLEDIACGG